ncbi:MAG: hypothetical protein KC502_21390 [Myxococcales bacterium]|nr:hypothetical protein [Myxococcales bacterium]
MHSPTISIRRLIPSLLLAVAACTGLSLGDNTPGQDTFMELGAIAVDHVTDTSFVLRKGPDATGDGVIKSLWAVPHKGTPKPIATLDGQGDVRVLFPHSGVLVMAESNGKEQLTLLDRTTFKVMASAVHDARYAGTRMSPSRRWIAVADNKHKSIPLLLIDTTTLKTRALPSNADWLEAMWARSSDTLLVMASWRDNQNKDKWQAGWKKTRLMAWRMDTLEKFAFQTAGDGFWANQLMDVVLPGYGADLFFSFSWVGVAPDDSYVVFPLLKISENKEETPMHQLAVVDLLAGKMGTVRFVDNAKGPVGFTSDGSSIISYRDVDRDKDGKNDGQDLLAMDINTLKIEQLTVPFSGLINFFITGDGHFVVVAGWNGSAKLSLFDLDADTGSTLAGPNLDLHEVVPRVKGKELWICDDGLHRLRVEKGTLDTIKLPFVAWHANLLPTADEIVTGDRDGETLVFVSPVSGKIVRTVHLPL